MKIIRVYSGDDGESHFEEVSPEQLDEIVNRVGPGDIQLNRRGGAQFLRLPHRPPAAVRGEPGRDRRVRMRRRLQGATGARRRLGRRKTSPAMVTLPVPPTRACGPPWPCPWPSPVSRAQRRTATGGWR